MTSNYANLGAMSPKPLILTLSVGFFHVHEPIAPKLAQFEVIFMIAISSMHTYIRPFIFAISEDRSS